MSISTRNQCQIVLKHLIDHGYITQLIATNYGVRRLASRIYDIRKGGVNLDVSVQRDDNGTKYARYSLNDAARAVERNLMNDGTAYNLTSLRAA
jgi:hypothetical protein